MANSKKFKDPNTYFDAEGVHDFEKGKTQAEINSAFADNAGAHNCLYRGKSLGTSVTAEQWEAIANGTFKDLYIGDYWTIGGVNYRIAAFDYLLNNGDTNCTTHHAVVVPDSALYNYVMNDTHTAVGGYAGSKMYKEGLAQAKSIIKAAFGATHILKHRIYLTNTIANGRPSLGAWYDSEADLMCEQMIYSSGIFSPVSNGINGNVPINHRVEKSQLPLFQHEPSKICNRATWWVRDIVTDTHFVAVNGDGRVDSRGAASSFGVRPYFCICKEAQ